MHNVFAELIETPLKPNPKALANKSSMPIKAKQHDIAPK